MKRIIEIIIPPRRSRLSIEERRQSRWWITLATIASMTVIIAIAILRDWPHPAIYALIAALAGFTSGAYIKWRR